MNRPSGAVPGVRFAIAISNTQAYRLKLTK